MIFVDFLIIFIADYYEKKNCSVKLIFSSMKTKIQTNLDKTSKHCQSFLLNTDSIK